MYITCSEHGGAHSSIRKSCNLTIGWTLGLYLTIEPYTLKQYRVQPTQTNAIQATATSTTASYCLLHQYAAGAPSLRGSLMAVKLPVSGSTRISCTTAPQGNAVTLWPRFSKPCSRRTLS